VIKTVRIRTAEDYRAAAERMENAVGALIKDIEPYSPAELAGLQSGDIVTAVNGRAVANEAEYMDAILSAEAGTELHLTVLRQGEYLELTIVKENALSDIAARGGGETFKIFQERIDPNTSK